RGVEVSVSPSPGVGSNVNSLRSVVLFVSDSTSQLSLSTEPLPGGVASVASRPSMVFQEAWLKLPELDRNEYPTTFGTFDGALRVISPVVRLMVTLAPGAAVRPTSVGESAITRLSTVTNVPAPLSEATRTDCQGA